MSRLWYSVLAAMSLAAAPVEPAASVRDAIYFGPSGPVRMRFRVAIAARPADEVWSAAVNALFDFCDRNGDGVLDAAERTVLEEPRSSKQNEVVLAQGGAAPLRLNFGKKNEPVTRAAFTAALRTAERGPISFTFVAAPAQSQQLSAALFRTLGHEADGKLSLADLAVARDRLAPLDVNEDEFISGNELLGRSTAIALNRFGSIAPPDMAEEAATSAPDFLFFDPVGGPAVKQLLTARAGKRATALTRKELGADEALFATLDKDRNGRLDSVELEAWLREPPAFDLTLDFNPARLSCAPATFKSEASGAIEGAVAGTRFRVDPLRDLSIDSTRNTQFDSLREQFKQLAKDKGTVTRPQLEKQPVALALFDLADRKPAGRVDLQQIEAALNVLAPLTACRVEISLVDRGNGLFEILDRNGDGRLSPRELIDAPAIVQPFVDAKGRLGPKDISRQFQVRAMLAGVPLVLAAANAPISAGESPRPAAKEALPAWFIKMDRNGDGEVSLREFLGPIELFRKLDKNGDGLISPEEARTAKIGM